MSGVWAVHIYDTEQSNKARSTFKSIFNAVSVPAGMIRNNLNDSRLCDIHRGCIICLNNVSGVLGGMLESITDSGDVIRDAPSLASTLLGQRPKHCHCKLQDHKESV